MQTALAKALELDDSLAEVHNGLAALKWAYHRDWPGAEREFRRAIELNPQVAEVHSHFSIYLSVMGRFDVAIAEGKRALELDPLSIRLIRNQGNRFYFARRYDEAVNQYREALELEPDDAAVHEELGNVYEQQGLDAEALAEWQRAIMLTGDEELALILSSANVADGFTGAVRAMARKRLERLNGLVNRGGYAPAVYFARACLRLGDKDEALWWLEEAREERNVYPLMINIDPFFDSVREDPRFAAIVESMNLK
jgi:tetratricopeptide (TPR) repeat protein